MLRPSLTRMSFIKMIKKAVNSASERSYKELTQEQVKVISSLVYANVKEGRRYLEGRECICKEYMQHPLLMDVLVRISVKKMKKEEFNRKFFYNGKVDIGDERSEEEMEEGKDVSVLKVDII